MSLHQQLENEIKTNAVAIYSKSYCPYCARAKTLIKSLGVNAHILELDTLSNGAELQEALTAFTKGQKTVPMVFVGGEFIGGSDATAAAHRDGSLVAKLKAAKAIPESQL